MKGLAFALLLCGCAAAARAESAAGFDISVSVDRTQVVIHEQVVLAVHVEHPDEARASWEPPAFEGFWMERLATRTQSQGSGGRRETTFRRALFPSHAGTLEIPASRLLLQHDGEPDRELSVPGSRVRVDALPADRPGAPPTSVVGQLQVRASVSERRVYRGRSLDLLFELWGEANVWDATLPALDSLFGDGVEVFPERRRLFIGESAGRATTRWTLRYSLVPEKLGRFELPAIRLRYFDPESRAYREAASEPVSFDVLAPRAGAPAPWGNQGSAKLARPLPWLRIGGIALLLAALATLVLRRLRRAFVRRFRGPAPISPRSAFENACQALGSDSFAPLLGLAVKAGIQARHRLDAAALTTDEIAARVDDGEAIALLRQLDARFTGRGEPPESLLAAVRSYLRL